MSTKAELEAMVAELEETLCWLETKLARPAAPIGRKAQVLAILKKEGHISVAAIAKRIGISARNVSSQLTYLRKDGIAIATDSIGRKFIE